EAYVDELYDEVSALYRLDQISTAAGKSDFGPLPRASVALIVVLVLCWLGMGVYVGVSYLKKRKSNKNH
ncbi:MAG: ABC transporter substrate-binding protein, partial [Clostridia bacterium]|nr:ABC transporter substrate-binding protein [Clostridia bacterium]